MRVETNPIEAAKRRFREVQEIMGRAAQVRQEYHDLEAFLRQAHHLFPDAFDEWPLPGLDGVPLVPVNRKMSSSIAPSEAPQKQRVGGKLRTSDIAEWVLKVHGPLHIREIMRRMRDQGWARNRDDIKAEKTLFNVMASHADRFTNKGKNVWGLAAKDI
jgi:hypothetical protein